MDSTIKLACWWLSLVAFKFDVILCEGIQTRAAYALLPLKIVGIDQVPFDDEISVLYITPPQHKEAMVMYMQDCDERNNK